MPTDGEPERLEGRATEAGMWRLTPGRRNSVRPLALEVGCLAGWRRLVGRGARGTAAPGLGQRGGGAGRLGLGRRGFGAESWWLRRGLPRVGYRRRSLARAGEVGVRLQVGLFVGPRFMPTQSCT